MPNRRTRKKSWYKILIVRRDNKKLKRRLIGDQKRKKRRVSVEGLSKFERTEKLRYDLEHKDYVRIVAPSNFSFVGNTIEMVGFINKLKRQFDSKRKVFVVMRRVERLSYDALVVLLSIMVRFRSNKIGFNGDMPVRKLASDVLKRSGFFEYLYNKESKDGRFNIGINRSLHTHAWKEVDPVLGEDVIAKASETIWGEKRRCQGVQRALLELMQNTNNHAEIGKAGEKHWWLSVSHMRKQKKVAFAFIDFGVGIFTSLNNKSMKSKFFGWAARLFSLHPYKNNAELLKLILDGELHRTVTNEHFRGKGLPGIKEILDRNQISNLNIISNDVKAHVDSNKFEKIEVNFSGTFVYWELNYNNVNCKWNP